MIMNQPKQAQHNHVCLPSISSLPFPTKYDAMPLNGFMQPPFPTEAIPCLSSEDESQPQTSKNSSSDDESMKSSSTFTVKGSWSQKEDQLLRFAVSNCHPILWDVVAEQVPGRSAIQCKERWLYRLHPEVKKTRFEKWEDDLIIKERSIHGNHWTLISNKLPGRTSCAVKNRWYSVLRNKSNLPSNMLF